MKYCPSFLFVAFCLILASCIKDDFIDDSVDPEVRITNKLDSIEIGTTYQFEAMYLNHVGVEEEVLFNWSSSNSSVIDISDTGLAEAIEFGNSIITVEYEDGQNILSDSFVLEVGQQTVSVPTERSGSIQSTSSYTLQGDFILKQNGSDLILEFESNYQASSSLPGLYVYLTNNPNTTSNAFEIGAVQEFSGAHSYEISNVDLFQYDYILYPSSWHS